MARKGNVPALAVLALVLIGAIVLMTYVPPIKNTLIEIIGAVVASP